MNRRGVKLLELLVVIAVIGVLVGLMLAAVQSVRVAAARTDCQNRLRQFGLATHNYHTTHRQFPDGVAYPFSKSEADTDERHAGLSWLTSLLPHLEQDELWRRAWVTHTSVPSGESDDHAAVAAHAIPPFRCPADSRTLGRYHYEPAASQNPPWGLTNYLGVSGNGFQLYNGIFHPRLRVTTADITDGISNTVMIGERPTGPHGYGSSWYSGWGTLRYFEGQLMPVNEEWANTPVEKTVCPPRTVFQSGKYDDPCHHHHFWSLHPGGANFAFADGSVKFLRYTAADILPALATRAGGEVITGDW
jgi:prepilin-type processing-associated H-X9-DG protein